MKINTVWAVYFSATDTTMKVVTTIAKEIAAREGVPMKTFDFTLPDVRKQEKSFSEGDLVVFGTPVYAGRVPNLLIKFVASIHGNGAPAVPVVLYGNRAYDDALMELKNTLRDGGFHPIAGGAFIGEHSFSTVLGGGRPDVSDLTVAKGFAWEICKKLEKLPDVSALEPLTVGGNDPIHPYYTPRDSKGNAIDIRKVKPEITDACNKCMICAKLCPMGAIDLEDPAKVPGICMKCCLCIKKCPVNARVFTDPGFLYHASELELMYTMPRKEPELFL